MVSKDFIYHNNENSMATFCSSSLFFFSFFKTLTLYINIIYKITVKPELSKFSMHSLQGGIGITYFRNIKYYIIYINIIIKI